MLVEKKLKGIFSTVETEVPFRAFDEFIDVLMDYLDDYAIKKTRLEVCENPLVIKAFEDCVVALFEQVDFDELAEMVNDDTISFAFRPELDEIERIEAEEEAERQRQLAIAKAEQDEKDRIQREKDALTEVQITIHKKHLNKAMALLQAAGFIKKAK